MTAEAMDSIAYSDGGRLRKRRRSGVRSSSSGLLGQPLHQPSACAPVQVGSWIDGLERHDSSGRTSSSILSRRHVPRSSTSSQCATEPGEQDGVLGTEICRLRSYFDMIGLGVMCLPASHIGILQCCPQRIANEVSESSLIIAPFKPSARRAASAAFTTRRRSLEASMRRCSSSGAIHCTFDSLHQQH